jgi:ABC-2 type transport system permease protein
MNRASTASWLTVARATAGVELRRWWRQPIAVVTSFVLPVLVGALVSLALGGGHHLDVTFAVVDLDRGPVGDAFVDEALRDPRLDEVVDVRRVGTRAEARRLVDDETVEAAIVLPARLSEGITAGTDGSRPTHIEVLRRDEPSLGADLAQTVVDVFDVEARATVVAHASTGGPLPESPRLEVATSAPGGRALDAATHYGPAIGMFFLMVALGAVVDGHVTDRRRGLVDRLQVARVPRSAVLTGRAATVLAIGCASLLVTAATMQLIFGRSWGPLPSVGALAVGAAVAYAGFAALLANVVRTPGQAQALTVALAFGMAVASGAFTPPGASSSRPPLAEVLPATIALDGFARVTTEAAGIATLAGPLALLITIGGAGFAIAGATARRRSA